MPDLSGIWMLGSDLIGADLWGSCDCFSVVWGPNEYERCNCGGCCRGIVCCEWKLRVSVEYMSGIEPKEFPGKGTKVSCLSHVGP